MTNLTWTKADIIESHKYICGYCGNLIASENGWEAVENPRSAPIAFVHICHFCHKPTFFDVDHNQYPGAAFGEPVSGIEDASVKELYDEARRTMRVSSYTATVLACRKLLMHIAVEKGAGAGDSFASYVQYLADKHYIPPDAIGWVDHIREKGNEANHEINIMVKEDAETLLSFVAMLRKVIYEFPARIKPSLKAPSPKAT